jgi:hypothetical protein
MSNQRRKGTNTTVDSMLWYKIKIIALNMSQHNNQVHANDLLEKGLRYIIETHQQYLPEVHKNNSINI